MFKILRNICFLIIIIAASLTVKAIEIELPLSGGNSISVSLTENFCSYDSSKLEMINNGITRSKIEYIYDNLLGSTTIPESGATFHLKEQSEFIIIHYGLLDINGNYFEEVDTSIIINLNHYEIPTATLTGGGNYCQGEEIPPLTVTFTGTAPWKLSYQPNNSVFVDEIFIEPEVMLAYYENYETTLRFISDANCSASINEHSELIINELPEAAIVGDTVFCPDDNAIYSTYQNSSYKYNWTIPLGAEYLASSELKSSYVALTWVESGNQEVNLEVEDINTGCSSGLLTQKMLVHELPAVKKDFDTLLCFGVKGYITLSPATNDNNTIYWNEHQLEAPSIDILNDESKDTITISYTETIPFGCSDEGSINIIEKCRPDVFVPEAFTPNNDGINDVLEIFGNHYERLTLNIYSANGQIIYTQFSGTPFWDGKINNKDAPNGVYYWRAIFYDVFGKEFKKEGNVTLIR